MFQELMPDYNEALSFWLKYAVADDCIIYIAPHHPTHESQGICSNTGKLIKAHYLKQNSFA